MVHAVYAHRKMNSKLNISMLSYRLGSLSAPILLLSWFVSFWFSSLTKNKFTSTLNWFILAWGSVVQSGFSQKSFMLTWLRSGHSLSFLFFSVYHTFKLNDIYPCLEAKWFFLHRRLKFSTILLLLLWLWISTASLEMVSADTRKYVTKWG